MAQSVPLAHKVLRAQLVLRVLWVLRDRRAHRVQQVRKVILGQQVPRVPKAHRASPA